METLSTSHRKVGISHGGARFAAYTLVQVTGEIPVCCLYSVPTVCKCNMKLKRKVNHNLSPLPSFRFLLNMLDQNGAKLSLLHLHSIKPSSRCMIMRQVSSTTCLYPATKCRHFRCADHDTIWFSVQQYLSSMSHTLLRHSLPLSLRFPPTEGIAGALLSSRLLSCQLWLSSHGYCYKVCYTIFSTLSINLLLTRWCSPRLLQLSYTVRSQLSLLLERR